MRYIIDGHNLIPKIPGLSLEMLDDEVELIKLLQKYCRLRRRYIEVYFDKAEFGWAGERKFGSVIAIFVPKDRTADQAILHRIARIKKEPQNYIVVSSDNRIRKYSRGARIPVITSEEFARELMDVQEGRREMIDTEKLITDIEIDEWLRIFSEPQRRNKP
jgi:hypothetical protein